MPHSNVLPVEVDLQRDFFTTDGSASAVRAVFASWPLDECKAWVEDAEEGVGLALEAEMETMKYFPRSNSSREVRDRLVQACVRLGVTFRYNCSVEGIKAVVASNVRKSTALGTMSLNAEDSSSSVGLAESTLADLDIRDQNGPPSLPSTSNGSEAGAHIILALWIEVSILSPLVMHPDTMQDSLLCSFRAACSWDAWMGLRTPRRYSTSL